MQPVTSQAGIEFLRTEVEMAQVFANIAATTDNPEKYLRNIEHARRAHHTVLHFLKTLPLGEDERDELNAKVMELRRQLATLGETV